MAINQNKNMSPILVKKADGTIIGGEICERQFADSPSSPLGWMEIAPTWREMTAEEVASANARQQKAAAHAAWLRATLPIVAKAAPYGYSLSGVAFAE